MKKIAIISAKRTPQGRFLGALAKYSTLDLGVAAANAALEKIDRQLIDLTIVGRVMPPDFNVARQIARKLELPLTSPAYTVNMVCGSGLQAILLAADAIQLGRANLVLCGGAESMSNVPHALMRSRTGVKLGDQQLVDLLVEGLSDPLISQHMGQTAERLAQQHGVTRQDQDAFALRSHQKAVAAQKSGEFDAELVALPELDHDEHPRADTSLEKLATLKPAFTADGTVTAGNASGINDAAAMLVLCDESTAQKHGWKPLAYLETGAIVGCDPTIMGIGPAHATRALCGRNNLSLSGFDTIEINEAFAAQVLACLRELKLPDDEPRLNPQGGGISMGHPVGASGARLVTHLAHRIAAGKSKRALATLCIGGGQGIAASIQS
jgi:acetyl-CoA C-acetyltransferase